MPSVFTLIMAGELPGRIVYEDADCVALLTIAPVSPGHTLVVPRAEIDHWTDLEPVLAAHLMTTAQGVGQALRRMFPERARVALLVAGLEVPHTHLHVFCIDSMHQLDLAAADHEPDPAGLDDIAARLRTELS